LPADGRNGRDFGAHGSFDDRAHPRSYQLWAAQHGGVLAMVAGAVLGLTGLGLLRGDVSRWGSFPRVG